MTALDFSHGDTMKPRDLAEIMATDYPEIWAATAGGYRIWHTGHFHHKVVEGFRGCTVECHESPSSRDGWSEKHGCRAPHSMCGILYDRSGGEYSRNTVYIKPNQVA